MKYIFLIPSILFYLAFTIWPLVKVFTLSLYKTNFISTKFIGLANYTAIFQDKAFIQSIVNSLTYMAIMVPAQILLSSLFAVAAFRLNKKWQDVSRVMLYLPILSAGIIIAQVWRWFFGASGPLNWILGLFSIAPINWFGDFIPSIPVIAFIVIISSFGGNVIILLSSIMSIDKGIIESATIDGASWSQIKWKIILPIIKPTLLLIGILTAIASLQIFENIYALSPYDYTATMTFYIYQQGFQFGKYGMASAEAIILLIITIALSFIKKGIEDEN